ncbi:hypothetical protein [Aeromicrobium stalagmiti]|uniref:hypothetical protein n=1 Tax=Aeromicrobium stalagmiti TaxID=2738988 RepID=UPI0015691439|nr:hypothetical protein [Aeromicrobium stalagmiti]NRQ49890.1 hypothetical protein [Aeromicrobium stalagmiti]
MALIPLSDVSPADWLVDDPGPAHLRARLGPSGFTAHVRVLHARPGEGDRDEGHLSDPLLDALCQVLARHTSTPSDCFFGLWDGYGEIHGGDAVDFLSAFSGSPRWPGRVFTREKPPPPERPAFSSPVMSGPRLGLGGEAYLLFGGPIAEAGRWGATHYRSGAPRDINSPNLMWPADHAWFVTTPIDGTWTGVGGTSDLVDDLLREPRLEVVRQRYDEGALR